MATFKDEENSKEYWWNKASDLRRAAGTIWLATNCKLALQEDGKETDLPEIGGSNSVCWMLYGLSLELLFKCLIVAAGTKPAPTHDLGKLSQAAGVKYSVKELKLLAFLQQSVVWDGKYPVPKNEEVWEKMCELEGDLLFDPEPMGGSFVSKPNKNWGWKPYDELFEKAARLLKL
jgi:hypothetical protein